jgi:hypothetical protein
MCGFAQVVAPQREAYRFESHIFTQPPRRRDSVQWQKHPPVGARRSNAGVSAKRVIEQARSTAPIQNSFSRATRREEVLKKILSIKGVWGECKEKPIAPEGRKICYQGPGTGFLASPSPNTKKRGSFPIQIGIRSDLNREDGFGSVGWVLTEVKVKIKKHLPLSDRRPALALVVR